MNSIRAWYSLQLSNRGGMPTRGSCLKIGVRLDIRPVGLPRQKGELADSASRMGRCTRIPLATWIAFSGWSMPTCTCNPNRSSCRTTNRSASTISR